MQGLMRRGAHLCIGLDLAQQNQHLGLNALQRRLGVTFKAQHQYRRGVGRPDQPETIGPVHPQAIDDENFFHWTNILSAHENQYFTMPVLLNINEFFTCEY